MRSTFNWDSTEMEVRSPDPRSLGDLYKHMRNWVPESDKAEMLCHALKTDLNLQHLVVVDERGVGAAASFCTYKTRVHLFNLGSIVKGGGSMLMDRIETLASALNLPVTLLATKGSESFYAQRGYKRTGKLTSVVRMRKRP